MTVQAVVIDTSDAPRDENNDIVVRYDTTMFTEPPLVLVTAMLTQPGTKVNQVACVTRRGDRGVSIAGFGVGHQLNILFVDKATSNVHGLGALGSTTAKDLFSTLVPTYPNFQNQASTLATPHVPHNVTPISFVETVGHTWVKTNTGKKTNETIIMSESDRLSYMVDTLSIDPGHATAPRGIYAAQAGQSPKNQEVVRIAFDPPWDTTPVVFVTPCYMGENKALKSPAAVSQVTREYFEVTSDDYSTDNVVNWLAVSPSLHTPSRKHLDAGFEQFLAHFPEHRGRVEQHRAELEAIILDGADPAGMGDIPFDDRPSMPKSTRDGPPPKLFLDFGAVGADSIGLILAAAGIPVARAARSASLIADAAYAASETTPLFDAEFEATLAATETASNDASIAKSRAAAVFKASVIVFHIKALKAVLISYAENATWQDWVIMCVKLLGAVGLMVLAAVTTAGTADAAALAGLLLRIGALALGAYVLKEDIERLLADLKAAGQEAPA
ncbi:MAG: hypothetical protein ABR601_00400 [Parasphingopyxis sp.]|nr:hypothetical protein [Sphingomonadales bacterium]